MYFIIDYLFYKTFFELLFTKRKNMLYSYKEYWWWIKS